MEVPVGVVSAAARLARPIKMAGIKDFISNFLGVQTSSVLPSKVVTVLDVTMGKNGERRMMEMVRSEKHEEIFRI
jgi:hypothetical protein